VPALRSAPGGDIIRRTHDRLWAARARVEEIFVDQHKRPCRIYSHAKYGQFALKILFITVGLAASYAGWSMNEACSTYRGTFRPADVVCDVPYGHELQITVAQPPLRATPAGRAEQAAKRSICRTSSDISWRLACDLPLNRELFVNLSPNRLPRVKCKLFIDCPAHY
jgi:hypothetical protein